MKIVVKEKNKEFFDECMFIQMNIRYVMKKPHRKVWYARKYCLSWAAVALAAILLILSNGLLHGIRVPEIFFIMFFGYYAFILIYNYFVINKNVNSYMNDENLENTFEITKEHISLENKKQNIELSFDSIKYIIINKETISFIPKEINATSIVMFISTKYKDDVMTALKKYKKEELVIDNSELYK